MEDLIAAISSAQGVGGIGIVRLSGEGAVEVADKIYRGSKKLNDCEDRYLNYGHIYEGDNLVDEVLIVKMLAPKTYTMEDVVEIYCHGGIISTRKILKLLLETGARLAEPGEFTKRAFLNGRMDLAQAESVIDLINAKTDVSYENTISQLEGKLSNSINEVRNELMSLNAFIVANVDFPDEDIEDILHEDIVKRCDSVISKLQKLLENAKIGKLVKDGIDTVILGRPNVGKSSFLNNILKEQRAIVTDIPGTTRDTIEEYVDMEGILLKIKDTAGIRHTEDEVERIGVERAKEQVETGDLIIAIFDLSIAPSKEDEEILNLISNKPAIILFNKSDLEVKWSDKDIEKFLKGKFNIKTSIKTEDVGNIIKEGIKEIFFNGEIDLKRETYATKLRHIDALKRAEKSVALAREGALREEFLDLIEIDINDALNALGEITGEVHTEDILDRVFKEFCIGK